MITRINFPTCPLCHTNWVPGDQGYITCSNKCGMCRKPEGGLIAGWVWKYFGRNLVWWSTNQTSIIVTFAPDNTPHKIDLPNLLPFDLTQEQLDLYLTFS